MHIVETQAIAALAAKGCAGYVAHAFVGSQLVPGVIPNDIDVLVLVDLPSDVWECPEGFEPSCELYGDLGLEWHSYRRGDVNLILCHDAEFYANWVKSAKICAGLGLTDRRARVLLHALIRDKRDIDTALVRAIGV